MNFYLFDFFLGYLKGKILIPKSDEPLYLRLALVPNDPWESDLNDFTLHPNLLHLNTRKIVKRKRLQKVYRVSNFSFHFFLRWKEIIFSIFFFIVARKSTRKCRLVSHFEDWSKWGRFESVYRWQKGSILSRCTSLWKSHFWGKTQEGKI